MKGLLIMSKLLLSKKGKTPLLPLFLSVVSGLLALAFIYIDYRSQPILFQAPSKSFITLFVIINLILNVLLAAISGIAFADFMTISKIFHERTESDALNNAENLNI